MKKVAVYSVLLVIGLVGSQLIGLLEEESYRFYSNLFKFLDMVCLSFIMIHVGFEFDIDKSRLKDYGWDYLVAMTAAAFPWIFVALYFVYLIPHATDMTAEQIWKESLLAARFAAPTSAGVLFSMLAAAGLAASWLFKKARLLAIFDDLDTILLIIPLKIMIIGFHFELTITLVAILLLLWVAWRYLHQFELPVRWQYVLLYSLFIAALSELISWFSLYIGGEVPIHIEVLLPAFVLGCVTVYPSKHLKKLHESEVKMQLAIERLAATLISACFMVLVGLSMPPMVGGLSEFLPASEAAILESLTWDVVLNHVLIVTILSNLGKMFPAFCYRKEATLRERLALAIGMFPRGEVGAGVLVISLSVGIEGAILMISMLSLALNLVMTGLFIYAIKLLINTDDVMPEERLFSDIH